MKPDFALSLSFDGIALLQRAAHLGGPDDGWYRLGAVSLTEPDLGAALKALRGKTVGPALDSGPEVKLLLPEEQVRFMVIDAAADRSGSLDAVKQALDGATPYPVSDLVYDWIQVGDKLHVAAVARETLAEAETFATDHDFVPLCFVTVPPKGNAFPREPFFGPTRTALTTLTPGVSVKGDDLPIAVLGDAPSATPPVQAPPTPTVSPPAQDDTPAAAQAAPPDDKTGAKQAKASQPEHPEPKDAPVAPKSAGAPKKPAKKPVSPDVKADAPNQDKAKAKSGAQAKPPQKPDPKPVAAKGDKSKAARTAEPPKAGAAEKRSKPETQADARPADKSARPLPSPAEVPGGAKPLAAAPGKEEKTAVPGFASIRARRDTAPNGARPALNADHTAPTAAQPVPDPETRPQTEQARLAAKAKASLTDRPKAAPDEDVTEPAAPSAGQRAASLASSAIARASTGLGKGIGFISRRTASDPGSDTGTDTPDAPVKPPESKVSRTRPRFRLRPRGAAAAMTADGIMDESERMTVFGARGRQKVGGKPRFLGLILTSILLLFLLAVGAWASLFLEGGIASLFRRDEAPVVASATPDVRQSDIATPSPETGAAIPETVLSLPVPDDANLQEGINIASLSEGVPALSDELIEGQLDGLSVPFEAEALTPEQAEARYAATGIWQRAPAPPDEPQQGILADLYVASIDPSVSQGDAVALAALREHLTDQRPVKRRNPPAFDSGLTFDDDGLIEPVPEGVVTPDGYTLILGAPPLKPPQRPAETLGDLAPAPTPEGTGPVADAGPVVADETLAGLRPRPRPGDLIEQNERANLGGISLLELSQKRPRLRPAVSEEKTEGEADETATEFAVASSIKPNRRPSGFASLVDRARKNEENAVVRTAAVAPRTVQPRIPSSANVAREATIKNAINLRKVNLIGVYGKPSARRALVRLSNGRYKKVKVGDRIDGGRVAAIGDDRLSYTKGGRQVVLRMPQG